MLESWELRKSLILTQRAVLGKKLVNELLLIKGSSSRLPGSSCQKLVIKSLDDVNFTISSIESVSSDNIAKANMEPRKLFTQNIMIFTSIEY